MENTGNLEIWLKHREFVLLKLLTTDSKGTRYFNICRNYFLTIFEAG